ncbi:MAG: pentapeptide repeat-containing protein, partial [Cyanobacteria bacterium]|nr:pentapeptide repeat-containing protein [Cyanobacteriota bacterium]
MASPVGGSPVSSPPPSPPPKAPEPRDTSGGASSPRVNSSPPPSPPKNNSFETSKPNSSSGSSSSSVAPSLEKKKEVSSGEDRLSAKASKTSPTSVDTPPDGSTSGKSTQLKKDTPTDSKISDTKASESLGVGSKKAIDPPQDSNTKTATASKDSKTSLVSDPLSNSSSKVAFETQQRLAKSAGLAMDPMRTMTQKTEPTPKSLVSTSVDTQLKTSSSERVEAKAAQVEAKKAEQSEQLEAKKAEKQAKEEAKEAQVLENQQLKENNKQLQELAKAQVKTQLAQLNDQKEAAKLLKTSIPDESKPAAALPKFSREAMAAKDFQLRNYDLKGVSLKGVSFDGVTFAGANLEGADFNGANLAKAKLNGADFKGSKLGGAEFYDRTRNAAADLTGVKLQGADLKNASFYGADFRNVDLKGADFQGANLEQAIFSGKDLRETQNLNKATSLRGAWLDGVNASGVDLSKMQLGSVDLTNANLKGANLQNAGLPKDLTGVQLAESNLRGVDLSGSDLSKAKSFQGALYDPQTTFTNALKKESQPPGQKAALNSGFDPVKAGLAFANPTLDFRGKQPTPTDLKGRDLIGASFDGVDFTGVNLNGVDFKGADLRNALLKGVDFTGAKLTGAMMSDKPNFLGAKLDGVTVDGRLQDQLSRGYSQAGIFQMADQNKLSPYADLLKVREQSEAFSKDSVKALEKAQKDTKGRIDELRTVSTDVKDRDGKPFKVIPDDKVESARKIFQEDLQKATSAIKNPDLVKEYQSTVDNARKLYGDDKVKQVAAILKRGGDASEVARLYGDAPETLGERTHMLEVAKTMQSFRDVDAAQINYILQGGTIQSKSEYTQFRNETLFSNAGGVMRELGKAGQSIPDVTGKLIKKLDGQGLVTKASMGAVELAAGSGSSYDLGRRGLGMVAPETAKDLKVSTVGGF